MLIASHLWQVDNVNFIEIIFKEKKSSHVQWCDYCTVRGSQPSNPFYNQWYKYAKLKTRLTLRNIDRTTLACICYYVNY